MVIVIGSGPAAIAAAVALVKQGREVTILDVGKTLPPDQQQVVDRMSRLPPEAWNKDDIATIMGQRQASTEAVHSKLSYGSSYSFANPSNALDVRWTQDTGFNYSLAQGGLSNVWGSSLLPYRQADIMDWPVSLTELEPHYRAVMDFVPGTHVADDLDEILPSYSSVHHDLVSSRQGRGFLEHLKFKKKPLKQAGIRFGHSRLAIRGSGDETHRDCAYCGLCLSGCPYGLIYSSAQTLGELKQRGVITYLGDHLVETFEDIGDEVIVKGRNPETGATFSIAAGRIFIAAGVLPTIKIVLESLKIFDRPIHLLDSQYFIYPMLRFKRTENVETERMHTSSQAFVEIDDKSISGYLVHLQIYGFSSFLLAELNRTFLKWPLKSGFFRRQFLGRLLIAQGFIHSNQSGEVELVLKQSADRPYLSARAKRSPKTLFTVLKIGWKLLCQSFNLGAFPLLPGLKFPNPGSGYHSGGTFPMRDHPGELETDTLGRLAGRGRVHLVDGSVLPSIPATSITLSAMANAHRIATAAARLDPS